MPIITCSECHGKLSTLAPACPHCGAPVAKTVELPKQTIAQIVPKPTVQPSTTADVNKDVNKKVGLKMFGIVLILIGVGLLIYQIVSPSDAQISQLHRDITAGGSGTTATNTIWYIPSFILFIFGGGLWKAGS